jgi:hypothetical protein
VPGKKITKKGENLNIHFRVQKRANVCRNLDRDTDSGKPLQGMKQDEGKMV